MSASRRSTAPLAALLSAGILGPTALAQRNDALAALEARLDAQQQRIAELERRAQTTWTDPAQQAEVRAIADAAIADAQQRADAATPSAGYDHGFVIRSADGDAMLKVRGLLLARYDHSLQDDAPDDDSRGGFEVARTRFGFAGHLADPSWKFFLWTGFTNTGSAVLLDATITKDFGEGLTLTAGQFKTPLWREWLVSETSQQVIERSLINKLAGGYTQGLLLGYTAEQYRVFASINDGLGEINGAALDEDAEYALTARAEWKPVGQWKQAGAFESFRGDEPFVLLGAAAHWQEGEAGTATTQADIFRWSADASFGFGGGNVFVALLGDHQRGGSDGDDLAALVQAGVFVSDRDELFVRYEWADHDAGALSIVTAGVNRFVKGFNLRLSADVGYSFEPVPAFWASGPAGWRTDRAGRDGQAVARAQVQLLF